MYETGVPNAVKSFAYVAENHYVRAIYLFFIYLFIFIFFFTQHNYWWTPWFCWWFVVVCFFFNIEMFPHCLMLDTTQCFLIVTNVVFHTEEQFRIPTMTKTPNLDSLFECVYIFADILNVQKNYNNLKNTLCVTGIVVTRQDNLVTYFTLS